MLGTCEINLKSDKFNYIFSHSLQNMPTDNAKDRWVTREVTEQLPVDLSVLS